MAMKKILLVDGFVEKGESAKKLNTKRQKLLRKAAPDLAIDFSVLTKMFFVVRHNKLEIFDMVKDAYITNYDAIIIDYWHHKPMQALALSTYASRHEIPFAPIETIESPPTDKLGELALLSDGTVPLPNSLISTGRLLPAAMKKHVDFMHFPCIVKSAQGAMGHKNFLVKNAREFRVVCLTFSKEVLIVQEYIPNDSDYRIIVINNEPRFVMKRTREPHSASHLNNVSQGAVALRVPNGSIPASAMKSVLRAAELVHRSGYAGVDLIINSDNQEHYILEVNKNPAIASGASRELIDEKISLYIDRIKGVMK